MGIILKTIGATLLFGAGYGLACYNHLYDMGNQQLRATRLAESVSAKDEKTLDQVLQACVSKKLQINEERAYQTLRDMIGPKGIQGIVGNQGSLDYMRQKQEVRGALEHAYKEAMGAFDSSLNLFEKSKYKGD